MFQYQEGNIPPSFCQSFWDENQRNDKNSPEVVEVIQLHKASQTTSTTPMLHPAQAIIPAQPSSPQKHLFDNPRTAMTQQPYLPLHNPGSRRRSSTCPLLQHPIHQ